MITLSTCLLGFWLAGAAGGVQQPQPSPGARIIASAKDWSITAQQFEQFLDLLPDQQHQYFDVNRREFLDQLVRLWVMAAEARTLGVDKTPKFEATVQFYSNNMLAGELHRQQVTGTETVNDEDVQTSYEANKADFTEIRLSHILILNADSPRVIEDRIPGGLPAAEARKRIEEVQARMRAGASFDALAREYSEDRGSRDSGGDVGYISKGQMAAEVERAAFALSNGSFSDIVESSFGFHILHVTDVKVTPLAEVSSQIRQKLDADRFSAQVEDRIKQSGVKIDESFFQKDALK